MRKKKFNPFVLLYIISAILLIISIAPIADTAAEIYRVKGRYAGYEEESLFNDFIENQIKTKKCKDFLNNPKVLENYAVNTCIM